VRGLGFGLDVGDDRSVRVPTAKASSSVAAAVAPSARSA